MAPKTPSTRYNDDFTWIHSNHAFKFGGKYQLSHYNGFGRQCISGCAAFSYTETGRAGDTNFATAGGNPFASLLLGYADSGSHRHHPLYRPAVALLRRILPG